jgi:hypothetical protein
MPDELTSGQRLAKLACDVRGPDCAHQDRTPAAPECSCGLPIEPPTWVAHWHSDKDPEPTGVDAVARYGQSPQLRRAVRVPGGWAEVGSLVNFYIDRTPPLSWREVGTCWAGVRHPLVEVKDA